MPVILTYMKASLIVFMKKKVKKKSPIHIKDLGYNENRTASTFLRENSHSTDRVVQPSPPPQSHPKKRKRKKTKKKKKEAST